MSFVASEAFKRNNRSGAEKMNEQEGRGLSRTLVRVHVMSEIAQSIDKVIKLGLADLLKEYGFKKSGRNWHKAQGENWLIVNVQASRGNIGSEGQFTINLGVYATSVAALAGQKPLGGKPREYDSTLRERLGVIVDGKDHWWRIDGGTNLPSIADDVVEKMKLFGLPWLSAHSEVAQISETLKDSPSLLSVCAAWLAGSKDEAIQRLHSAIASRPAAKSHFRAWASRNGVQL